MSALAEVIDFIVDLCQATVSQECAPKGDGYGIGKSTARKKTMLAYAAFALIWFVVAGTTKRLRYSAVLTGGSGFQCLGFMLLTVKVHGSKSVKGISSKMLEMFILYLGFRLSSTCLKNGYLPFDYTGDRVYQTADFCSLALCSHLLYCIHKTYRHTYEEERDTFSVKWVAISCFILAYNLHPGLNKNLFFDVDWAFSTYLETIALVPQLWMMSVKGGVVDPQTAHFVAALAMSSIFTFLFWYDNYAYVETKSMKFGGKAVISCHILKILCCADFMYYYVLSLFRGTAVVLPNREEY